MTISTYLDEVAAALAKAEVWSFDMLKAGELVWQGFLSHQPPEECAKAIRIECQS